MEPTPVDRALRLSRKGRHLFAPMAKAVCAVLRVQKIRSLTVRTICRLEGGQMWSETFRDLMRSYYQVEIGRHSYGSSLWPGRLPRGTIVGSYCSIADNFIALRRNHTIDRASQHPLFYNSNLGVVEPGLIKDHADNPLTIGSDVWIGLNVVVTPSCKNIGNGAIIAAGSVVTADVPAFAVTGGVPARFIRWRFPEITRDALVTSQWWKRPVMDLTGIIDLFTRTTSEEVAQSIKAAVGGKLAGN